MAYTQTSAPPQGNGKSSGPRAGFWRRFAAAFIDGLIFIVVELVLILALKGVGYALAIIAQATYFTMLEGGPRGQTVGKSAMGIRVIDFQTGGPIGYGRGFIRYIGRIVSGVVILLGYLWMLWDPENQTWHDKLAGTVVVPVAAYPLPIRV